MRDPSRELDAGEGRAQVPSAKAVMRLPGRARSGLRALFDLGFHGRGRHAQVKEIAERQQISVRYLEEIMQDLRRAKLVRAQRGPRGGYALARPAEAISVADILAALGALPAAIGEPAIPGLSSIAWAAAPKAEGVDIPSLVWEEVAERIARTLAQTSLADFIARAESAGISRAAAPPPMYFI